MQLSYGSKAAAKPSSQPRSFRFKRVSFRMKCDRPGGPRPESSLRTCAAASREPQALRPEGAVDVMSHLLCQTANESERSSYAVCSQMLDGSAGSASSSVDSCES